jgi:catechol 2,3-dioxygenase-like lactoylglutathione lyase family enzyme
MSNPGPQFDQLNIVVSDMDRSLAFYRLLGVDAPNVWKSPGGHQHAGAASGGVDVDFHNASFAQVWNQGWKGRTDLAGRVVVGFRLADRSEVGALYATLTWARHRGLQPPYDALWGARYAVVEDPDGLAIGLMSPVDAARRSEPPG